MTPFPEWCVYWLLDDEWPEHIETDACGFDRNGSHNAGEYVCMCGWPEMRMAA